MFEIVNDDPCNSTNESDESSNFLKHLGLGNCSWNSLWDSFIEEKRRLICYVKKSANDKLKRLKKTLV